MTVFIPDRILDEQITGDPTLAVSTPFVLTVLLPFLVYGIKPPLYAPALVNNSGGKGEDTLICGILTSNCLCTPTFLCTHPTFTFPDAEYGFCGVFVVFCVSVLCVVVCVCVRFRMCSLEHHHINKRSGRGGGDHRAGANLRPRLPKLI